MSGEEAQDRDTLRHLIRNVDPHIKVGKDAEEEDEINMTIIKTSRKYLSQICTTSFQTIMYDRGREKAHVCSLEFTSKMVGVPTY